MIDELTEFQDEVELKFKQLSNLNLDVTSVDTISQLKGESLMMKSPFPVQTFGQILVVSS